MSERRWNIFFCMLALALGGCCYVFFRGNSHIAILVRRIVELESVSWKGFQILSWYLPDFLWGFALACGLVVIYGCERSLGCATVAFVCGCLWELMQFANVVSGTGDVLDVLMYLAGGLLCIGINMKRRRKDEENC